MLSRLSNYNMAARRSPFAVLVDFEVEPGCVGAFVRRHLPEASQYMRFRVAVRAVEAWLLADSSNLASFLRVRPERVPADPDALPRPKGSMVNLARRSVSSAIRRDMVPRDGSGATEGPAYASRLQEFALEHWAIDRAIERSGSLRRSIAAFRTLRTSGEKTQGAPTVK